MTGDIRKILLSSHAAGSLQMEMRVAHAFERHKWRAERGTYYTDPDTGKLREIDIYVSQVLKRPERQKGIGAPLINMDIFCECKSLAGSHVLLSPGSPPEYFENAHMGYWIGREDDLQKIVREIAEQASIKDHTRIRALYDYALGRAYAYGERALCYPVSMPPPPVNFIARSFRETKDGKINGDRTSDQARANPVWRAIQSSLSAIQAAEANARNGSLEYVCGLEMMFSRSQKIQIRCCFLSRR